MTEPGELWSDRLSALQDMVLRPFLRKVLSMIPERFDFGFALSCLRGGTRVAREGWNGKGMWLALEYPEHDSKMTLPFIYMKTADGHLVPWLASQTDMLAVDWMLVAEPEGAA